MRISAFIISVFFFFSITASVSAEDNVVKTGPKGDEGRLFNYNYYPHGQVDYHQPKKQCRLAKIPRVACIERYHNTIGQKGETPSLDDVKCEERSCSFTPTTGYLYYNRRMKVTIRRPYYNQPMYPPATICRNPNSRCCSPRMECPVYGCCATTTAWTCTQNYRNHEGYFYVANNYYGKGRTFYHPLYSSHKKRTYVARVIVQIPDGCKCSRKKLTGPTPCPEPTPPPQP